MTQYQIPGYLRAKVALIFQVTKTRYIARATHKESLFDTEVLFSELIDSIKLHSVLRRRYQTLLNIKGIGKRTASKLIILLPQLGTKSEQDRSQLCSYVGLDARSSKMSNKKKHSERLKNIRFTLFHAAISLIQNNSSYRDYAKARFENGDKTHTVVLSCARKFLYQANAEIRKLEMI
ncbi:MAG: transposase [Candidatus Caenarcaniphilales bacterium]|nr:transposase [Candidatus Caenarcaniphilales bacterium]